VNGQRIVDVARSTLDAAETLVTTWTSLEPVVKSLIPKVRAYAEREDVDARDATTLLKDVAGVTRAVASAATAVMRASEGQARLAVLIAGPKIERKGAGELTERQLVAVVIETARRMKDEHGVCPLGCRSRKRTLPIETTADAEAGSANGGATAP
jgi:hypothetical protein